jgi:uncharacterized protein YjbI with pentapeptide repeats
MRVSRVRDGRSCRRWRIFGTTITDTSFRGATLRDATLSGLSAEGVRNKFERVDFTKADLRGTAHLSADLIDCDFSRANLSQVDFKGDVFIGCRFEGVLNETIFHRHDVMNRALPPNEMKNVDFQRAKLRAVAFRELDLDSVQWPEDDENIVADDYPGVVDRFWSVISTRSDPGSQALTGLFDN